MKTETLLAGVFSLLLFAVAGHATVTVDFSVFSENHRAGTSLTLDFAVDGSGNVTLDATSSDTDSATQATANELDGPVGSTADPSAYNSTFSLLLDGGGGYYVYMVSGKGLGITGNTALRIDDPPNETLTATADMEGAILIESVEWASRANTTVDMLLTAPAITLTNSLSAASGTWDLSSYGINMMDAETLDFSNVDLGNMNDGYALAGLTFEVMGNGITVTTTADEDDGNYLPANGAGISLREAVNYAPDGALIQFDNALSGATITLSSGQLLVERSVTIDASSLAEGLAIDASAASRIFEFGAGTTNVLDSLTLTNGYVSGSAPDHNGGAIYVNSNAVLSINRSSICGNYSTDNGGGIYNIGTATLTVNECTISDNSAGYAGGGIKNYGTTSINNSTLAGNSCYAIGGGGAIQNFEAYLTLNHVTVIGNSSVGKGGGIRNAYLGMMVCTNSIICENTSTQGSNIHNSGTLNTHSCLIDTDPMLAPLGDYGGPTQTMPPLLASPAIDAGVATSLTNDQRGIARPVDGDGDGSAQYDIGACEFGEDTTPLLAITNPASGTVLNKEVTETTLSGTHNEWVVGTMIWTNAASGASGSIGVSGSEFQVPSIALAVGANLITVLGTNVYGSVASDSITITRNIEYGEHGGISRIHYVSTSGTAVWPFTNWTTAAATIQDAVNTAVADDTVLVNDGSYSSGHAEVYNVDNRVALTKAVVLQSVNGADETFIVGAGPIGSSAVRCAYVTHGATLIGFTLTNGHTHGGPVAEETSGGGVLFDGGGTASSCRISGNAAQQYGGGVFFMEGGKLVNCLISDNSASGSLGGGAFFRAGGTLNNCTLSGNSADDGGGVYCYSDGTPDGGTLNNCILWANIATYGADNWQEDIGGDGSFSNACTIPTIGAGCVTNDPQFAGAGDYHLQSSSPCIDAGISLVAITNDFDGTPRPQDGDGDGNALYDIGAYESEGGIPLLAITNSVDGTTVYREIDEIIINGTHNQWVVGSLNWTNAASSASGTFAVDGLEFDVSILLEVGVNPITVTGTNGGGVTASDSVTITRSSEYSEFGGASRTHYVSTGGAGVWPFTNWTTAATVIQDAVNAAASGDTVLVTNGTYSSGGAEVYSMSNRVALTKAVTLQSVSGPDVTFIAGAEDSEGGIGPAAVRCAYLTNGAVIAGFTLTNGHTLSSGTSAGQHSGGGILMDGGSVSNCVVSGNTAKLRGGGVYISVDSTLSDCVISGNEAREGGGVYLPLAGTLNDCVISSNYASGSGGIYSLGTLTLNRCAINGNSCDRFAGGIENNEGTLTLNDCLVMNNSVLSAGSEAGGIANSGTLTINNSTLAGNSASYGGGIYSYDSTLTLNHATLSGNVATNDGGGIYLDSGTLFATNSIIAGNTAIHGTGNLFNISGTLHTNAHNLIDVDPMLAPLGDYGGPTLTMPPLAGSPAINAGTATSLSTDQRGAPRSDGQPDIGAVEVQSTAIVLNANDSGTGSLRDAIEWADSGGTVIFTNTLAAQTITLTNGQITIDKNLTIDASALDSPVAVDGNASSRHFEFAAGTTNLLDSLTLSNGYTPGNGGAIVLNTNSVLALNHCLLTGNSAGGLGGGGIYNDRGTLTLDHSTLARNYALYAVAGNGVGGGIYNTGTLTLNNAAVVGNSAYWGGGGIDNRGLLTLNNATLAGNSAAYYGGGIHVSAEATLNATNSIVAANSAPTGTNLYNLGTLHTNANNLLDGDPLFVDAVGGNYRLQTNSPCIDAAIALAWITDDIEGTPRPLNGDGIGAALPDIGAYEHISPLHSTDGDAHTDYEEYIADTDPADSSHWFRVTGLSAGMPTTVSFDPASARRQYSLLYSTNLVDGIWAAVSGQVDIVGSGGTNSLAHTNSFPAVFYRVEVELME